MEIYAPADKEYNRRDVCSMNQDSGDETILRNVYEKGSNNPGVKQNDRYQENVQYRLEYL